MVTALLDHKPILKCDFPDHTMEVEISDSDESENESNDDNGNVENNFVKLSINLVFEVFFNFDSFYF